MTVDPADLDPRGELLYLFPHRESWSQRSSVFVTTRWQGAALREVGGRLACSFWVQELHASGEAVAGR